MENQTANSNFMLYLMLIVCSVLAAINSIEVYRMTNLWKQALSLKTHYFQSCLKNQYITRTFFCFFSFFSIFSALILTIGLIIDYIYFARKLIESYLNLVYLIFGPTLLISSILALVNWKDTVYICTDVLEKHFSLSNATSIMFCFLLGGVVTILVEFYTTIDLYSNTITRNPNGSKTLNALFWYVSIKMKNSTRIISSYRQNQSNNMNDDNNVNINNNNNDNQNTNLLDRENIDDLDSIALNGHQYPNDHLKSVDMKDNDQILQVKVNDNELIKNISDNDQYKNFIQENK